MPEVKDQPTAPTDEQTDTTLDLPVAEDTPDTPDAPTADESPEPARKIPALNEARPINDAPVLAGDSVDWKETDDRVKMTAPGFPRWVTTLDRTYYPVELIEDENGVHGQIEVHPGHVSELRSHDAGTTYKLVE